MNWRPPKTRPRDGPPEIWNNGIKGIAGTNWQQVEIDRSARKRIADACIQQWIETGRKKKKIFQPLLARTKIFRK